MFCLVCVLLVLWLMQTAPSGTGLAAVIDMDIAKAELMTGIDYAVVSLKAYKATVLQASVGVLAGVGAALVGFWNVSNAIMIFCVVGAALVDMSTGALIAVRNGTYKSRALAGGALGKVVRLLFVALAILTDLIMAALLPSEQGSALILSVTPVTKFMLAAAFIAEFISILKFAQHSEGPNSPIVRVLARTVGRLTGVLDAEMREHGLTEYHAHTKVQTPSGEIHAHLDVEGMPNQPKDQPEEGDENVRDA
jgi:hypothetical protein